MWVGVGRGVRRSVMCGREPHHRQPPLERGVVEAHQPARLQCVAHLLVPAERVAFGAGHDARCERAKDVRRVQVIDPPGGCKTGESFNDGLGR